MEINYKSSEFIVHLKKCGTYNAITYYAYYLHHPNAPAIISHNELLCNDMCSVPGVQITGGGGGAQTEKTRKIYF